MRTARPLPWWLVKVAAGLLLVAQLALVLGFGHPVERLAVPVVAGQVIAVAGGLVSLAHYGLLKSSSPDISRPGALVTSRGLYRLIRHPMYLGDLVLMLGLALMCASVLAGACVVVGGYALVRLARAEDSMLRERFPREFAAYAARTRLIVPGAL